MEYLTKKWVKNLENNINSDIKKSIKKLKNNANIFNNDISWGNLKIDCSISKFEIDFDLDLIILRIGCSIRGDVNLDSEEKIVLDYISFERLASQDLFIASTLWTLLLIKIEKELEKL